MNDILTFTNILIFFLGFLVGEISFLTAWTIKEKYRKAIPHKERDEMMDEIISAATKVKESKF